MPVKVIPAVQTHRVSQAASVKLLRVAAYARVSRGKLDKSVFDKWAKEAKIKRSEALSGLLPFDDYVTWLQESVPQAKTN